MVDQCSFWGRTRSPRSPASRSARYSQSSAMNHSRLPNQSQRPAATTSTTTNTSPRSSLGAAGRARGRSAGAWWRSPRVAQVGSEAMGAPEHVPVDRSKPVPAYESPPRRPESWLSDRPGELVEDGPAPRRPARPPGPRPGLRPLARPAVRGQAHPHRRRAREGCPRRRRRGRARSGPRCFGRAPVIHDLTVALTVWGFLDDEPAKELVDLRKRLFEEVWHPHHYAELRRLVDLVPRGPCG